jgi:hypothetical protein
MWVLTNSRSNGSGAGKRILYRIQNWTQPPEGPSLRGKRQISVPEVFPLQLYNLPRALEAAQWTSFLLYVLLQVDNQGGQRLTDIRSESE